MSIDLPKHRVSVALVHPQIASNTGNVGRLCVATGTPLHLVRPMGFVLDDRHLKRAGMDYWPRLVLSVHDDLDAFGRAMADRRAWLFTARGGRPLWDCPLADGDCLAFGSETHGLPDRLLDASPDRRVRIPQRAGERCLNLSTAVGVGLYECLRRFAADFPASGIPEPADTVGPMDRILVVDDHVANCVPLVKLFRFAGIGARCAAAGAEALAALAGHRFDVVLLDVMMPDMDGFAVLEAIRADPQHAAVAVLMYSAMTDVESQTRAMRLGAQGYVLKGTEFDGVLRHVRRFLPEARQT